MERKKWGKDEQRGRDRNGGREQKIKEKKGWKERIEGKKHTEKGR